MLYPRQQNTKVKTKIESEESEGIIKIGTAENLTNSSKLCLTAYLL
jgi:hypothetical protein